MQIPVWELFPIWRVGTCPVPAVSHIYCTSCGLTHYTPTPSRQSSLAGVDFSTSPLSPHPSPLPLSRDPLAWARTVCTPEISIDDRRSAQPSSHLYRLMDNQGGTCYRESPTIWIHSSVVTHNINPQEFSLLYP
jgi:hypothetical protein